MNHAVPATAATIPNAGQQTALRIIDISGFLFYSGRKFLIACYFFATISVIVRGSAFTSCRNGKSGDAVCKKF
jgi:hypothetical protein